MQWRGLAISRKTTNGKWEKFMESRAPAVEIDLR